jgi:hypothetical protein
MKFEITLTGTTYNEYETTMELEAEDEEAMRKKIEDMDDKGELVEALESQISNEGMIEDVDWNIQEMKD